MKNKWSLTNLPPAGDPDVGPYFWSLYEAGTAEQDRLAIQDRWLNNYRLFRGNHWHSPIRIMSDIASGRRSRLSLNILAANIHRTVANITARAPVAEVILVGETTNPHDDVLTEKIRIWNNAEEQQASLGSSVLNQEVYGITIEKAIYDRRNGMPRSIVLDPWASVPAPGYYKEINDQPYHCHRWGDEPENVELQFNVAGVEEDGTLPRVLGEEREDERIVPSGTTSTSINPALNYVPTKDPNINQSVHAGNALVVEIWIRDYATRMVEHEQWVLDAEGNEIRVVQKLEEPVYPGGIRVVTLTNQGRLVLNDCRNPNINWALPIDDVRHTHSFDHLPFYKSNSYEDTNSPYGFSMAELVGDINLAIDDLWSQITAYLRMSMFPPLILPKDTGIELNKVRYVPRLILRPNSAATGNGIRWLSMPTPPSWLFQALSHLMEFFDRISQIEDADRGSQPGGVIAASAIQMLQERGAVLIKAKIRAVDYLVRQRGRFAISMYQNFGDTHEELVVGGERIMARGHDFIGFTVNYVVESGSTVARTEVQEQQQAMELYQMKAIDRRALLEKLKVKDWQKIIERMGESDLDMALSILIEAGLPPEMAQQLHQQLMQPQGGPGDLAGQPGAPAQPGVPKAMQGEAM
jgi:hypothetical protein